MQQDRNKSRRPSSSIQQNSARRKEKPRKAYDWTQDRRPSNQDRRRTQGYQEQTLDFSGGNVTFENHSSGYADNSRAAVRASREASGPVRTRPPTPQMGAAPAMASGPRMPRAPGGPRAAGATAPRRRTSAARPGGRAEKSVG